MSRLVVNEAAYEVRIGGSGSAPALMLLHGFTGRGATWGPHLATLRRRSKTIQVDLLGHGRSDLPADPARHAVERQAADLVALARSIAGCPIDLVGYSFGARIAMAMALVVPSLIRRLILESPSPGLADPQERAARRVADDRLADDIERDGVPAFVERWESLPLFATHAALTLATRRRIHAARLRNSPGGLAGSLRGAGQGAMAPLHDRLRDIRVPTLVVCGELDSVRSRSEFVARQIPGASLAVIPGVGHTPDLESPAHFRAVILQFLTAQGTPSSSPETTAEETV